MLGLCYCFECRGCHIILREAIEIFLGSSKNFIRNFGSIEKYKYVNHSENIFGFKELKEEMERLEREAEAIQRAEDEAREILADVRKKQREEREARRKADLGNLCCH